MANNLKILYQIADSTPTPIDIYQPADPTWAKIMIGVAIATVTVLIIGVWLNR